MLLCVVLLCAAWGPREEKKNQTKMRGNSIVLDVPSPYLVLQEWPGLASRGPGAVQFADLYRMRSGLLCLLQPICWCCYRLVTVLKPTAKVYRVLQYVRQEAYHCFRKRNLHVFSQPRVEGVSVSVSERAC